MCVASASSVQSHQLPVVLTSIDVHCVVLVAETPSAHKSPAATLPEEEPSVADGGAGAGGLARDGWRRAIALYTLAVEAEQGAWEPLLGRARAYAAIGMWCVRCCWVSSICRLYVCWHVVRALLLGFLL